MRLSELATTLDARLVGDGSIEITRPVHPADAALPTDLALAMEPALLPLLANSPARAAVIAEGLEVPAGVLDGAIVVGRPRLALAGVTGAFARAPRVARGVHATALIEAGARVDPSAAIGPFVHVGADAEIGPDSVLISHVTVGAEARIGAGCLLHPGVRIGAGTVLGDRVICQHNASIGSDGFGYVTAEPGSVESVQACGTVAATNQRILRIGSLGRAVLHDDVEVGACSTIDRGTVADTVIGRGSKIDNMVHIGHNCVIGENCMICGQVGIAGSSRLGDRVVLAGRVAVSDHVSIGSDSVVGMCAALHRDVPPRSVMAGFVPAAPRREAFERIAAVGRLKGLFRAVRRLADRVQVLEEDAGTPDR